MKEFQGIKCPKCGKKGLGYASHPHAYGWKDYNRVACRYCDARFPVSQIEALKPAAQPSGKGGGNERH